MASSLNKPLRILHAPMHALYQPPLFVKGLRALGHRADAMYQQPAIWSDVYPELNPIVLNTTDISSKGLAFMAHALDNYDVFHLHSGYGPFFSSIRGNQLALLKKAGKTVVMSRWGCRDGRTPSSFNEERKLCAICPIPYSFCNDSINRERLENEERYVDVHINHEPDRFEFNNRSEYVPGAIDTELWKPGLDIPEQHRLPELPEGHLRVLHAVGGSNRGDVKGTSLVERSIDTLRAKGLKLEYHGITGQSFLDLRYYIDQSDIVVDQMRYQAFGSFARESMSMGKPVVGHVRRSLREHLPGLPLIDAAEETLCDTLERLALDRDRRESAGRASRKYALEQFDYRRVGEMLQTLYHRAAGSDHGA